MKKQEMQHIGACKVRVFGWLLGKLEKLRDKSYRRQSNYYGKKHFSKIHEEQMKGL